MRAHRAHRSTRPAPVATPQPQKQWPLSAPPLPSSPPAPRSPGTSSIAPARAFPGRERVGSGNVSSSDARAARCRDRSSSRAAAPHARATSRLTAPSPSPAPPSTANSPPRPRTRLASPSACARRYVRPALERHPRPDGSFSISRRASSRRASSRDRGDARKHPASLASIAQRTCASPSPLTAASPVPTATGRSRSRGEGSRGEEARAHRPPPRLQGETLAVTRSISFADEPVRTTRDRETPSCSTRPGRFHARETSGAESASPPIDPPRMTRRRASRGPRSAPGSAPALPDSGTDVIPSVPIRGARRLRWRLRVLPRCFEVARERSAVAAPRLATKF